MTDYADIEKINALQTEQAQLQRALDMLDDDGTVSFVVVAPTEGSVNNTAMPVQCAVADAPQSMISGVTAGLRKRYNDINKELNDLGVTGIPEDHPPPVS